MVLVHSSTCRRYLLNVLQHSWDAACLLEHQPKCTVYDSKIYAYKMPRAHQQPYRTHRNFIDSMCSLNLFNHRAGRTSVTEMVKVVLKKVFLVHTFCGVLFVVRHLYVYGMIHELLPAIENDFCIFTHVIFIASQTRNV